MKKDRVTVYLCTPFDRRFFRGEWEDPQTGGRRSQSLRTEDPALAEKRRAELEYEINHGLHQRATALGWAEFRERFERDHLDGLRPKSAAKGRTVMDTFEAVCNPRRLRDVDAEALRRFDRGMRLRPVGKKVGMAAWSRRNYLRLLHKALACAKAWGLIPEVPGFPTVKVPRRRPQPVPEADWERLLAAAPTPAWRAYLLCGWFAGLRLQEAYDLRWAPSDDFAWVDFAAGRVVMPAAAVKADEDEWLPLHSRLKEALQALPRESGERVFLFRVGRDQREIARSGLSKKVIALAKKAGVKLGMHKLRKGFGCRLAKSQPAAVLHRLMRHKSMQVTMDFYASVDDALHGAIEEI